MLITGLLQRKNTRTTAAIAAALLLSMMVLGLVFMAGPARAVPQPCDIDCPPPPNSPPQVDANNATVTVNEGQTATNTGTYSDSDGDPVTLTASSGNVSGGSQSSGTWSWSYQTTDGPAQNTVTIFASDGTDSSSTSFTLNVNNVAPSGIFNADPTSLNEGSTFNLSVTNTFDPSSADTQAGFTYAFSCQDTTGIFGTPVGNFSSFSSGNIYSCRTTDSSQRTVRARIKDKDNAVTEYSRSVTVNNVAPQATFVAPDYVKAGSQFSLALINPSDPSSADMTAGFHYAFSCDGASLASATYANSGPASSTNCTNTSSPATLNVEGKIIDKDGGSNPYSHAVIVDGARPSGTVSINGGKLRTTSRKVTLSLSAPDPAPTSGVASMRFSNNGKTWSSWMAYATSKAWTLSKGTGTKTVFVQYKDNAGFVSAKAKDTIVYRP